MNFKHYHIGHFINQPQTEKKFELLRFETMQEPDVDDFHKHTFYEILWIEKGITKQYIDYKVYDISDNTLFFISPNQLHYFEAWHGLEGSTIMFTEDFFLLNQQNKDLLFELTFLDNLYTSPFLNLSNENIEELKPILKLLEDEKNRTDSLESILQSFLQILLLKIQRIVNQKQINPITTNYLVTFKKFKNLLDLHFQQNRAVSYFADLLSITTHHLNLISKCISGNTASDVIHARIILEAKRMLTFTDLSIAEIGFRLGFEESSYFSRFFRKGTKTTPLQFRNEMSQKYHI